MSQELWATYSVKDHLDPRSLAADIMLFDRLVFPVPEVGRFPENSGSPVESGPVEWNRNPEEWARWKKNNWNPERQKWLLDLLQPVIRKVEWRNSGTTHDEYRSETVKLADQGVPDYAFVATRTTLTRDLPSYVTGVAALGPAYRSVEEMEREWQIRSTDAPRRMPGGALAALLAWEFIAPDPNDQRLSDDELLRETVAFITDDAGFRRHRTAFVEWQQKYIRDGATDPESIGRAMAEMRDLLEDEKKSAGKLAIRKLTRYAFRVAPAGMGIAVAVGSFPGGLTAAATGAFLSVGAIAVDETLFKSADRAPVSPTAFVHDMRRHFGWK